MAEMDKTVTRVGIYIVIFLIILFLTAGSTEDPNLHTNEGYDEPPWDELDPGIRRVVRLLWNAGFCTTDSGDGISKRGIPCAMDCPNVTMVVEHEDGFAEADRLHELLIKSRVAGFCPGEDCDTAQIYIECTYSPLDGYCTLSLFGVDDSMLPEDLDA